MAEGWLRHFGGDRLDAVSAGTKPKRVHPLAIEVMAECGVDISGHSSDQVRDYETDPFDLVVTVCDRAKASCPVFPRAMQMIHRSFEDPDDPRLSDDQLRPIFRRVRDEIRDWAYQFVQSRITSHLPRSVLGQDYRIDRTKNPGLSEKGGHDGS